MSIIPLRQSELTTDSYSNRVERCADFSPHVQTGIVECTEGDIASMEQGGNRELSGETL